MAGVGSTPSTAEAAATGDVAMSEASAPPTVAKSAEGEASTSSSAAESAKPKGKKRQGVVLAAEKKVTSKLLDKAGGGPDEKIFVINE